ncbi:hypothetical protein ACGFZU_39105 [Streptomyces tendae]|uniref:hypothetical protein n=1 Tax=Streptomyces tendae TaxID=1932 RepID=UPI0037126D99
MLAQQRQHEFLDQEPGFGPLAAGGHVEDGGALQVDLVRGRVGEYPREVGGGVGAETPVDHGVQVVGGAESR